MLLKQKEGTGKKCVNKILESKMNEEEEAQNNNSGDPDDHPTTSLSSEVTPAMMQRKQSISVSNDPQSFLTEGNKHFIYKRFSCAITAYSEGLKLFKEKEEEADSEAVEIEPNECERNNKSCSQQSRDDSCILELYSNRALSHNSINNYRGALSDSEKVLSKDPTYFKAIVQRAKALAGLRQHEKAINFVYDAINLPSEKFGCGSGGEKEKQGDQLKELQALLKRLKSMKQQSETGEFYDVPRILERPFEPAPSDWGEYIGPVTVKSIPGKGRGLVAACDLPASKLVMACRAFEIIYLDGKSDPEESLSEESKGALLNGGFKIEEDRTLNFLARKVYDRLAISPERRSDFYQLHAGNDLGHLEPPPNDQEPPPLDMTRIYGICRTNTFANSGDSYPEVEKSVGVWLFPAFVNHQCVGGNCTWKIFGDFIFVRTFKPVKKGEELVHSYVSPAYPFKARKEVFTRLGFVCNCSLCELDQSLPQSVHDEKDKLKLLVQNQEVKFSQLDESRNSQDYSKRVEASIFLLERIIAKLEDIQPKHGMYNASLLDPLQKLGLKYFGIGEFQKTTKIMDRACALMKTCMLPHGVADCTMWIVAAYLQMGNVKEAKKSAKIFKEYLELAYGNTHVLKVLAPWIIEPMTQWGLIKNQNC